MPAQVMATDSRRWHSSLQGQRCLPEAQSPCCWSHREPPGLQAPPAHKSSAHLMRNPIVSRSLSTCELHGLPRGLRKTPHLCRGSRSMILLWVHQHMQPVIHCYAAPGCLRKRQGCCEICGTHARAPTRMNPTSVRLSMHMDPPDCCLQ